METSIFFLHTIRYETKTQGKISGNGAAILMKEFSIFRERALLNKGTIDTKYPLIFNQSTSLIILCLI